MSELFASVADKPVTALRICIPNAGVWFADADLDEASGLSGRVTVRVGSLALSGTVVPGFSGVFGLGGKIRVVGGAGGWSKNVTPRHYHNDAGVKASTVLTDAARAVGETMVPTTADRVGVDFVRQMGPASRVLEQVLGSVPWWVDAAGATQMGAREPQEVTGAYELLAFDPRAQLATLAVDDPSTIAIGSVLRARLDPPVTVRELELVMLGSKLRLHAWTGGSLSTTGRVARALRSMIREATGQKVFGKYRYRLQSMAADGRVNLQAVSKADGLPDILPVSMKPGAAGWHAELVPGTEVLVEFIGGEVTDPIVTGFPGKGEPGGVPVTLSYGGGTAPVARVGDTVAVFFPPVIPFTGTVAGAPASGVMTIAGSSQGIIQTGRAGLLA